MRPGWTRSRGPSGAQVPNLPFSSFSSRRYEELPSAPQSDFSCSFLSALGKQGGQKRECVCLPFRSRLCSDLGTASNFLKNYFNKVQPLPRWRREGSTRLGRGEKPWVLSCVSTPVRVSGPLTSLPAQLEPRLCGGWKVKVQGPGPGPALRGSGPRASAAPGLRWGLGGLGRSARSAVRVSWKPQAAPHPRFDFLPLLSPVYNFTNE